MNAIFNLVARYRELPEGWGFPPQPPLEKGGCALRDTLMFLTDQDGIAQLCRWYFGILTATPFILEAFGDDEHYDPSAVHPGMFSPSTLFLPEPENQMLEIDWIPGPDDADALSGALTFDGDSTGYTGTLVLGSHTHAIRLTHNNDIHPAVFPEALGLRCGFDNATVATEPSFSVALRVAGFDHAGILARVTDSHLTDLNRAGMLAVFDSLPFPWLKLAAAWLAVHRLEEDV